MQAVDPLPGLPPRGIAVNLRVIFVRRDQLIKNLNPLTAKAAKFPNLRSQRSVGKSHKTQGTERGVWSVERGAWSVEHGVWSMGQI